MLLRSGRIINNNLPPYYNLMTNEFSEFIKHATFTKNDILDDAFYQQDYDNSVVIVPFGNSDEISEVQKHCDVHKDIPIEIKLLYMYIADKTVESNLGDFTFMNFKEFVTFQNRNSQRKRSFIDIAIRYGGMGHIVVVSYSLIHKMYFMRHDGGSNGYECEENDIKYDTYIPNTENTKMYTFGTLITDIINNDTFDLI